MKCFEELMLKEMDVVNMVRRKIMEKGKVISFASATEKYGFMYMIAHMTIGESHGALEIIEETTGTLSEECEDNELFAEWLLELNVTDFCCAVDDYLKIHRNCHIAATLYMGNGGAISYMTVCEEKHGCCDCGKEGSGEFLIGVYCSPVSEKELDEWTISLKSCAEAMLGVMQNMPGTGKKQENESAVCLSMQLDHAVTEMFEDLEWTNAYGMTTLLLNRAGLSELSEKVNLSLCNQAYRSTEKAHCITQMQQLLADYYAKLGTERIETHDEIAMYDAMCVVRTVTRGEWVLDLAIALSRIDGCGESERSGVFSPCLIVTKREKRGKERCYVNMLSVEELVEGYGSCFEFRVNDRESVIVSVNVLPKCNE